MMPLEASGVIGAVAGIAEIAKDALSPDASPRRVTSVPPAGQ